MAQNYEATVLFVDDEKSILDAMRRVCRTSGWSVLVANSGKEALELFRTSVIDVVVSDMRMPEMTGAELLAEVASNYPDTIRILLTGYADMESTIAAINDGGIYSYLSKPWCNEQLKETIQKGFEHKRLLRERQQLLDITQQQCQQLDELNSSLEDKVKARTKQLEKSVEVLNQTHRDLSRSYTASVELLSGIIEVHQHLDQSRNRDLAKIASKMSKTLGCDKKARRQIYYATLLKDIGKVGLAENLLQIPYDKLNPAELKTFKAHPTLGQALLMAVPALNEAGLYIRHQHERINGAGFPDALSGDAIPMGSRIIAIIRDYSLLLDGMLLPKKLSDKEAIEYLKAKAGKFYDKDLVFLFEHLLQQESVLAKKGKERRVALEELEDGMVLSRDVLVDTGVVLVGQGSVINEKIRHILASLCQSAEVPPRIFVEVCREYESLNEADISDVA